MIDKIRLKKPLDRLSEEFVGFYLEEFFKRNSKLRKKFENNELKSKDEKLIIKNVRNELNKVYGQFWLKKRHRSFNERKFTKELYEKIFKITGKPKTILDLGGGLNVLSYSKDIFYYVVELSQRDCSEIKKLMKNNGIKGEVIQSNLIFERNFPKIDICFMFKLLDFFDHKVSEELIKSIDCKYLVVSFSTKTIKNKRMNYPRRGWFDVMIRRLGFSFDKLYFSNEIFYVISLSKN